MLAVALALLVGGCAAVERLGGRIDRVLGTAETSSPAESAAPSPSPGDAKAGRDAAPAPARIEPPPPKPEPRRPPEPPFRPQEVVGVDEARAAFLLGPPGQVDDQPPAVVWQYRGPDCEARLFFYMDVNSKEYRVLTYQVMPEETDAGECFQSIRAAYE